MLGRRLPADVELVDSSKVIWPDVIALAPHGLETGQDNGLQASVAVMASDLLFESLHSRSRSGRCPAGCPRLRRRGVDHTLDLGDLVGREAALFGVLADQLLARSVVDAENLVGGHVALDPLNLRSEPP